MRRNHDASFKAHVALEALHVSFEDWTTHDRISTLVNNDLCILLIETERAMETRIQEMIYDLLRQNQSGTVVPFRD